MRGMEGRLVSLLVKQGAQNRRWFGGAQIFGPLEQTPLSTLVEHSSVSMVEQKDGLLYLGPETESSSRSAAQRIDSAVRFGPETETSSASVVQQKNDMVRPSPEMHTRKGLRAGFKNWCKSRLAS